MADNHVDKTAGTAWTSIKGDNLIIADPQFVDAERFDFRVRSGSPCYDAGVPGSQYNDPDGSRSDIGAFAAAYAKVAAAAGPSPLPGSWMPSPYTYQEGARPGIRVGSPGLRVRVLDMRGRSIKRAETVPGSRFELPAGPAGVHFLVIENAARQKSIHRHLRIR
jgi:hypothetical protein